MAMLKLLVALVGSFVPPSDAAGNTAIAASNPVRRVVNLLMNMQKKIEAEGNESEVLYDKFMCYCENGDGSLDKSIRAAQERIPQLKSSIEESIAAHQQTTSELAGHKDGRAQAKKAVETATAMRAKEKADFDKESAETKANIDALARAIPAIAKGVAGFLQTNSATVLRQLSVTMDMSTSDREMLASFLALDSQDEDGEDYVPQSGQILGIQKQMKDEMQKDLSDLESEEASRVGICDSLVAAKTKEIGAASNAIEAKTGRIGDLAVEIATLKNDLEDTSEALAEDLKFSTNLKSMCAKKSREWSLYQKTQSAELVALAETVKLLNDDDALELFKKTLPSPAGLLQDATSFLQVRASSKEPFRKQRALEALRGAMGSDRRLMLLTMGLQGRKAGFEQVIKNIAKLVLLLKNEQADDDNKKEWCEEEIDKTEDAIKGLNRAISDVEKAIANDQDSLAALTSAIVALTSGIQELDVQVAEATDQRKKENVVYVETLASDTAAISLLGIAKNRLNKFYNPKLYAAPQKRDLTEEQRITQNMGGELAPTPPPGGIAGTGLVGFLQARPAPPPAADLSYKKKGEESGGVIAMIDMLKADLEEQVLEIQNNEREAQKDYEAYMKASSEKRAADSKAIADKEGTKADLEADVQDSREQRKSTEVELAGSTKEMADLHKTCDWLVQNYNLRKESRANEVDSLQKATAVLSGSDYSL